MFNLSGSEIVVILLLALVVLGPEKLPDALRRAGRTYAELKKMGNTFQAEVKSALDEPMKEMKDTADLLRQAADFSDEPAAKPASRPGVRVNPRSAVAPATSPVSVDDVPAAVTPASTEDLINQTLSGGATPEVAGEAESPAPAAADETPTA